MKCLVFAALFCLSVPQFAQSVPEIKFQARTDFFKLPPDLYFGEAAGVAVNSKGHVFVFSRGSTTGPAYGAAAAQLLEFDSDGKYIREIGHHLYAWSFAHAVKVDKNDNIWVADKGSDMVIKFSPEGRVLMVFGRRQEASDEGTGPLKHPKPPLPPIDGEFRQVTDMAWDASGNTYISDGYINSRIAKIDNDGNWIKSWGEPGTGQGSSVLRTVLPPMTQATCMWPIAATGASRSSTEMAGFCASFASTCPMITRFIRGWETCHRKCPLLLRHRRH